MCGVACGGASSTTVVLRPVNPLLANVYVAISGTKAEVDGLATQLRHARNDHLARGFTVTPAAHGRVVCTTTDRMPSNVPPSIKKLVGQKVTVTVYGGNLAASFCQGRGVRRSLR
jgi:hypothetical protein